MELLCYIKRKFGKKVRFGFKNRRFQNPGFAQKGEGQRPKKPQLSGRASNSVFWLVTLYSEVFWLPKRVNRDISCITTKVRKSATDVQKQCK